MTVPIPNLTLQVATSSDAKSVTSTGAKTFNIAAPGGSAGGFSLPLLGAIAAALFFAFRGK